MRLKSSLVSGAGNTFHIIDRSEAANAKLSTNDMSKLIQGICEDHPADGGIFLDFSKDPQIEWSFFNNDGSIAEMCGNATRCVGYYMSEKIKSKNTKWNLNTIAGAIEINKVESRQYKVIMTKIESLKSPHGFFCNTGVPHLVLPLEDFEAYRNKKNFAKSLRDHKDFFPQGTNVTFVSPTKDPSKVLAVSFERGVEDFTLACGTGAVAAAFFNTQSVGIKNTEVQMPGGRLKIDLSNLAKPAMEGPAELLQEIEYVVRSK